MNDTDLPTAVAVAAPRRRTVATLLTTLGSGLITGAADDDPSGIATYSQVGSQFGYATSWTMLFTYPLLQPINLA